MKRIGILGGTFDPPHNGHLLMANEVLFNLGLEEIWFMPTNIPPHKKYEQHITNEDRLKLLSLAISDHPHFMLQRIELDREGPSYTYDTMKILKERYPDNNYYFIIGGDMVEYLPHWYRINDLVEIVQFVGVKRPGFAVNSNYNVIEVTVPQFEVSSSEIRSRIVKGQTTRYLLPEKVEQYIEEKNLYGTKRGS
ncbi:nicotinate-nucleotide adenylyltransferase [Bacillus luteolus]|uniref:Probable nicotinate-nucleotide adenylyltransferase n=1 Tax=Litchfieldia luteola TaxID=682179 RepID=A0ABR9QHT8_9BACI|nr:nicotinate-nucleotide adenylyltransferase [Cytobacillus luteolus]MBE4908055.1 nicotinate-nucleotide adenylyltransferase [Cytobacillus luteolus]MBP1942838.1 nicotinate-nucleotide adenylyltransferase [Cytobacillus luteolus]